MDADEKSPAMPTGKGKKRGPKPKPAEEQLAQLTIRLTPKLKYGLELLARGQHRSLSQAIEWALQVGLNSFEVGIEREPLGTIVDSVWAEPGEAFRLFSLYERAPELLEFDERAACELVQRSAEVRAINSGIELGRKQTARKVTKDSQQQERESDELLLSYFAFVFKVWPAIMDAAQRIANTGRETSGLRLLEALGFFVPEELTPTLIQALAKLPPPEPFSMEEWRKTVQSINEMAGERGENLARALERGDALKRAKPEKV